MSNVQLFVRCVITSALASYSIHAHRNVLPPSATQSQHHPISPNDAMDSRQLFLCCMTTSASTVSSRRAPVQGESVGESVLAIGSDRKSQNIYSSELISSQHSCLNCDISDSIADNTDSNLTGREQDWLRLQDSHSSSMPRLNDSRRLQILRVTHSHQNSIL
jgi:hypothetical protein